MEKLERVLVAEDGARTALVDAQAEAAAIRAAGVQDARRIESEALEASTLAVASRREEILAAARAEAAAATADAVAVREKLLTGARGRFEATVNSGAASLEG
ncbi:MAG TPA: hypothetical protein VIL15_05260 [Coriobacteriia bacterium]